MQAHSESEIRKSFINCSKGAAQRINIPHEVAKAAWDRLIFLSWIDPGSPRTGYVGAEAENGLRGLILEKNPHKGEGGARMCQICLTLHPGGGVSSNGPSPPRTTTTRWARTSAPTSRAATTHWAGRSPRRSGRYGGDHGSRGSRGPHPAECPGLDPAGCGCHGGRAWRRCIRQPLSAKALSDMSECE